MATGIYDVARYGSLHDVQYDYFGRTLAAASSDGTIRLFDTASHELLVELRGHRAPALSVCWAQGARFASTLASGSANGHVIIWREARPGATVTMQQVHDLNVTSAANTVAFSPAEQGLALAVAGGDELGIVTMVTRREVSGAGEQWQVKSFPAHEGGVVGLSWAPTNNAAILATGPSVSRAATLAPRRFVTGGVDGLVCVWGEEKTDWVLEATLSDEALPDDAVRDVAWRPNVGIPSSLIVSCTQGGVVAIWVQDILGMPWRLHCHWKVDGDARRLAWSKAGTLLAVSVGDQGSLLYQETKEGPWKLITSCDD